jgi:NADH-quinone oxidoreductase subunit N
MPSFDIAQIAPAAPEIFLALASMVLLMLGAFRGDGYTRALSWFAVLVLVLTAALVIAGGSDEPVTGFGGLFIVDSFAAYMKVLVLLGSATAIIMSIAYIEREKFARTEYPVIMLFATLGMMMMISANDLIALYIGLELQSLALYVAAAIRRDSVRSTEAGLKYFVLGALASGMLLYGASMVYGFAGTTTFEGLAQVLGGSYSVGVVVGVAFIIAGLAFKVSAVPFHMWTPDVYEGAPTSITAFFAVAPKVAATALFVRTLMGPFGGLLDQWQQIIIFISVASMLLGSFGAIYQTNIKRLMAYSAIGHIGYVLIGLAAGNQVGIRGVAIYLAIYMAAAAGTFACILCMRVRGTMVEGIEDLRGLARTNPLLAFAMAIFMFSLAGIPPLAGFFAKLFVFQAAIEAELYTLAVIGVLTSVVGAYYYVRIVKLMYFDEPTEVFDRPIGGEMRLVLAGTGIFTLLFFVWPTPILAGADWAAKALFPG